MPTSSAEHELLFGILAMQNNFITHDQFLSGFREWTNDKRRRFGDVLVEQHALETGVRKVLDSLVEAHVKNHESDPQRSLAATSMSTELSSQVFSVDRDRLLESVLDFGSVNTGNATVTLSLGKTTSDGRFQILRPHRKGGLGQVFVARDEELDREVALKQIKDRRADDQEQRERFLREAEITGKLEHPGVVPVYGMGEDESGRPYYAMRFIRGRSLQEEITTYHSSVHSSSTSSRNKEFRRLIGWLIDVCQAIEYAHSRGVLHRDIKPANIMIGRYGETLVVDWGLARVAGLDESLRQATDEQPVLSNLSGGSSETIAGRTLGTPAYMSPEQARGSIDLLGPASDVYSLGATLFVILTGKPPVEGAADLNDVIEGRIPSPRQINPQVDQALDAVCRKAMAHRMESRYGSAADLAADLEAWLADEPVTAWQEPVSIRARRWCRRHQTGVMTAVAAVLILTATSSIAAVLLKNKNRDLNTANNTIRQQVMQLDRQNKNLATANDTIKQTNRQLVAANNATTAAKLRADGVTDYLVAAFRKVDPNQDGRKLTVFEVLQRSEDELDEQLAKDPLTRADLLSAIGKSYQGLGLYPEMLEVFQREHALRKEIHDQDDARTLNAAYYVALSLFYAGKDVDAAKMHQATLEKQRKTLGERHTDTLTSMNGLAMAYSSAGRTQEAVELYEQLLEKRRELNGDDAAETLTAINNLATGYQKDGQLRRALELFTQSYEKRRELQGEDHRMTLLGMDRLGSIHLALGEVDKAIPFYEEALKKRRAKFGDDHPHTVESISGLAFALRDAGRLQDALPLLEEALAARRKSLSDDHPSTITSMNNLARVYLELADFDKALPLVEEGVNKNTQNLGGDHPKTLALKNTLGISYFRAGKPESAVLVFEDMLKIYRRDLGDDHPTMLTIQNNLAMCYRNVGRYADALPLFESTLAWRREELKNDHPKTMLSIQNLASLLRLLGRLDDAKPLAEESMTLHQEKLGDDHRQTISAMNVLAEILIERGELREGQQLAEKALQVATDYLEGDHPDVMNAMTTVGTAALKAEQLERATEIFSQSLKMRRQRLAEDHPATLRSLTDVARVQLKTGAVEKAVELATESAEKSKQKLGEKHPATLSAQCTLGIAFREHGQLDQAQRLLGDVLADQTEILGASHPRTLRTQHALALTHVQAGRDAKAQPLLTHVVDCRREVLGAAHPDTLRCSLDLAACQMTLDNLDDALATLNVVWQQRPTQSPLLSSEQTLLRDTIQAHIDLYQARGDEMARGQWVKRLDELQ